MALISLKQLGAGAYSGSFQVSGSTGVTGSLSLTGVTGTPNAKILINSSNNKLNIGDTIVVTDGNNRIGIGDSAPSSPDTELHIKSDTPVITFQRTNNNQKSAIDFQGSGGTVGSSIEYVADTNDLSFQTFDGSNPHERLRLEDGADGNIKVSGSTQITGSLYVSSSIYGDGSNLTGITSGIFQQTGSSQATTNDLQITGSLVATGAVTASDNVEVGGDLLVTEYIKHKGDVNTLIRFTDNRIRFDAGGMTFIGIHDDDDAPFTATINPGSNKINFKAMDENNDVLLKTNSETFKVELYHAGNEKLTTEAGGINVTGHITASGNISSSGNITGSDIYASGKLYGDGSELTGISSGIFQTTGSSRNTTNDLQITGSLFVNTALTSSTAIKTNNIQNGYPTSNNWGESLEGSYFNNFTNETHVSEILRFIAGAMSHSLDVSDAAPNTKIFGSVSTTHTEGSTTSKGSLLNGVLGSTYENARLSAAWTSSAFIDMSETASYKEALDYLELKGWVQSSDRGTSDDDVGTNPFHGSYASRIPSTIQTQATLGTNSFVVSANASGTTAVSSNSNYFGLGGLTSGGATAYNVRIVASQSFSDNYSDTTPDQDSTFTTSSFVDYTQDSFGTSGDGLILSKIVTSQPAVIPSAYQDGDFNSVSGDLSGRKYTGGATSATSISASGYYATHDIKVGLKSGSQSDFVFNNGTDSNTRFYLYIGGVTTDITNSQPTVVVSSALNRTGFSATSRSLSGAPYLLTTTYNFTFNSEVSKSFDPAHGYRTNILVNSNPTDTWDNIGSTSLTNTTTTVNNSGVSSTGATNYVWDLTKAVKRTSGEEPHISDIAVASSSFSFSLDSNSENIDQNRSSDESQNYNLIFRATGYNWKGTSVTSNSSTISFYDATLFGQDSTSGSMAVYSRAQGYDTNTLQDTTETFVGEDFRIVVADNVQAFNGAYFTTDSFQTNDEGDDTLGRNDLQVKPGYLVDPTGSYGYWFTNNSLQESNAGYRYYIRRFQTDGGTKTSMTVNLSSKTLVAWNSTSDGIACAILFESSGNGSGNNSSLGTARIYDPTATTSNLIEADISQDHFKNPFSTAISLYGNTGGSISSGTYTIPIRNADGMYLDSNDNELYVIVRYKGNPAPISQITLSYS